jgi:F-type H+-transporting ATPase subunit epsilon
MSSYQLSIITPDGKVFDDQVESLIAPGAEGAFGVLGQHAPMVTSLAKGVLMFRQNQEENFYAISSGILEVDQQSNVLLLSDYAHRASGSDEAKEKVRTFH